jgi:photosystem II stability/assembly factor-like uncharacterized protein
VEDIITALTKDFIAFSSKILQTRSIISKKEELIGDHYWYPEACILLKWLIVTILVVILAACSPPQTYPLIDSAETADSPLADSPTNPEETPQSSKSNAQPLWISELKMFDQHKGWGLDDLGRILRTVEGPSLWKDVSPAQPDPKTYITPAFLSPNQAVVLYYTPDTDKFVSWITVDGGGSWSKGNPLPDDSPGLMTPIQLFFLNDHQGWFAAYFNPGIDGVETVIYETRDGGHNWDLAHLSLPQNGSDPGKRLPGRLVMPYENLFTFTSPTYGFASNGSLYTTQDGGRNWDMIILEPPDNSLYRENPYLFVSPPSFLTTQVGYLMMTVFNSEQASNGPEDVLPAVPIANYLYFTEDGGASWTGIDAPALIGKAHFLSPNSGWFLGKDDPSPGILPRLYKTIDGGETWQLIHEAPRLPLGTQLVFTNDNQGYAYNLYATRQQNVYQPFDDRAGTTPYLFITSDGGLTWEEIVPNLKLKTEK